MEEAKTRARGCSASKEGKDKGKFSVCPPVHHVDEQRVCFLNKGTWGDKVHTCHVQFVGVGS
jgi:hypothetical protein